MTQSLLHWYEVKIPEEIARGLKLDHFFLPDGRHVLIGPSLPPLNEEFYAWVRERGLPAE